MTCWTMIRLELFIYPTHMYKRSELRQRMSSNWRMSHARSVEFTADERSRSLRKEQRAMVAEWMGSTEIAEFVLLDHCSDLPRLGIWSLCIGKPLFNCWSEVVCVDLLSLQPAGSEACQELADGKRAGMRGVTELFEAVLVGRSCWIFTDYQVLYHNQALHATHAG